MEPIPAKCCPEYAELSRRGFLQAGAGSLAGLAALTSWLPRVAVARDYRSTLRDTIVWIYLRGAADGLSMCVPWGDDDYYLARPSLAIPRPDSGAAARCIDLDGFFGLSPAMSALRPAYLSGDLLFVHACGSPDPSRSHFDAQRFMEVGQVSSDTSLTGWLGRHLASVAPADPAAMLRAVGISTGLQRVLEGGPHTLPIPDLANFGLLGNPATKTARTNALRDMYATVADPLRATASTTLATVGLLDQIGFSTYQPSGGAQYNSAESLGYALKTSAALIKAQIGVEAVAIDVQGWDTHSAQGPVSGTMAVLMNRLSSALAAFHQDMSAGSSPGYIVAVVSEFGRRVFENGSLGTDHGHGNAMMLMGPAVGGGRVLRHWQGLATENLYDYADLQVTIDYRDVLAEIIEQRLGNPNIASIFPGYTPVHRGVLA
jgi:uncharacterized protein (DUF1501 family)